MARFTVSSKEEAAIESERLLADGASTLIKEAPGGYWVLFCYSDERGIPAFGTDRFYMNLPLRHPSNQISA